MWWLLVVVVLLVLILLIPVGIRARYNENGGTAWITFGPFRFLLYPSKKKISASDVVTGFARKKSVKGGKISDFIPLLGDVLELLSELRKRLRGKTVTLKVILAGDDPADLAINYGKAWAALGNLMPRLEHLFVIRKRDLEVECDFTADKTLVYADIHISIPLIRLIGIVFKHGSRIMKKYWSIIEQRKGGASL